MSYLMPHEFWGFPVWLVGLGTILSPGDCWRLFSLIILCSFTLHPWVIFSHLGEYLRNLLQISGVLYVWFLLSDTRSHELEWLLSPCPFGSVSSIQGVNRALPEFLLSACQFGNPLKAVSWGNRRVVSQWSLFFVTWSTMFWKLSFYIFDVFVVAVCLFQKGG